MNATHVNNAIIILDDVTIRYPDTSSFSHISLQVNIGENIAIIGDNEPLKNALIEALGGKVPLIMGKTSFPFFREVIKKDPGSHQLLSPQKCIAYVSSRHQFRNLSNTNEFYYQQRFNSSDSENSLTVQEYLSVVKPSILNTQWTPNQTIEKLKLNHLLEEELIKLSSGETKRVLIAAALIKSPVLLLLNNPLAGLDVQSRQEIIELVNQIAQSGITIVMSASTNEIPSCINHVAVVDKENQIRVVTRNDFHPAKMESCHTMIDEKELKALLGNSPAPFYRDIVYMKDVSIRYGDKVILNNINWSVKQSERWALLGHNGAGKSTLLSLINGDNPQAFANHIILFDRKKGSGESIWDIKKKIGFFSSELYQYFPVETSCLHAVESGFYDTIGLFRISQPHITERALRWMKLFEIDSLKGKLLKHVSSIHQRLCLLARALIKNPALLILDEPCQGFDEYQRVHFKQLINSVCTLSNVTLIYVSHYQDDIPESVTKVLQLKNGIQFNP